MQNSWMILAALLGMIIMLGFLCSRTQAKRHKKRQVDGLENTCQLLTLMKSIQQHRGVSSGILGGKTQQEGKLKNLSNTADLQIELLNTAMSAQHKAEWNTVVSQWLAIQTSWNKTEVLVNFENHCDILENIHSLILDVTDSSALTSSSENEEQILAGEIFGHFPALIEDLGQLRALSTHAAASQDCITAFRLHLQFLMAQLSRHNHYLSQKNNREYDVLIKEVNMIVALIKQEILNTESIRIDPDKLFQRVTHVMDSCFSTIDKGVNQLKMTQVSS